MADDLLGAIGEALTQAGETIEEVVTELGEGDLEGAGNALVEGAEDTAEAAGEVMEQIDLSVSPQVSVQVGDASVVVGGTVAVGGPQGQFGVDVGVFGETREGGEVTGRGRWAWPPMWMSLRGRSTSSPGATWRPRAKPVENIAPRRG